MIFTYVVSCMLNNDVGHQKTDINFQSKQKRKCREMLEELKEITLIKYG